MIQMGGKLDEVSHAIGAMHESVKLMHQDIKEVKAKISQVETYQKQLNGTVIINKKDIENIKEDQAEEKVKRKQASKDIQELKGLKKVALGLIAGLTAIGQGVIIVLQKMGIL